MLQHMITLLLEFCEIHYSASLLKDPQPHSGCTGAQAGFLAVGKALSIAGNLDDLLAGLSGALCCRPFSLYPPPKNV